MCVCHDGAPPDDVDTFIAILVGSYFVSLICNQVLSFVRPAQRDGTLLTKVSAILHSARHGGNSAQH